MLRSILIVIIFLLGINSSAQKTEEGFDFNFKPTTNFPYYFVTTEEKDGKWYREAYFIQHGSQAMEAWYKDKECTISDGVARWFYPNRSPKSIGKYVDGKRDGLWRWYHDNGRLKDSIIYSNGMRLGQSLGWDKDGRVCDSASFDGKGHGFFIAWYKNGNIQRVGNIIQDTARNLTWKYFYENGDPLAVEKYSKGELLTVECYDENGVARSEKACKGKEAEFPGGMQGWRRFLEKNLNANVPVDNKAPVGVFPIYVQFIVNEDGSLSDIHALTNVGFGMEKEVLRLMNKSPDWEPALEFGRPVKAYRIQPVTFQVIEE